MFLLKSHDNLDSKITTTKISFYFVYLHGEVGEGVEVSVVDDFTHEAHPDGHDVLDAVLQQVGRSHRGLHTLSTAHVLLGSTHLKGLIPRNLLPSRSEQHEVLPFGSI